MYTFAYTHHKDGRPTRSYAVIEYLKEHGPSYKKDIYWGVWEELPTSRGVNSKFFTRLNCSGLAHYNPHTHKWHLGPHPEDGSTLLKWHYSSGHYQTTSWFVTCEGDKWGGNH